MSRIQKPLVADLIDALIRRYQELGDTPPDWAYPLVPTIPLIGKNYQARTGILVYASAENLAHYEQQPDTVPYYLKDERVWNRHRAALESEPRDGFFPHVHMGPFDNGSLIVATAYYLWKKRQLTFQQPLDLLECIAAANFCKFAIAGVVNKDHAGDPDKVSVSLPYVLADLEALAPSVCFLPKRILNQQSV